MVKVLILTEGGRNIGFGHATRMLAVYQAFEEKGIKPKILIKGDDSVGSVLGNANWEIFDWINNPTEIERKFGRVDIILIDSYLAPKEVYDHLSKISEVPAYYDDFGRIEYPCGVVINGNIHAQLINYPKNPCVKYLLGTHYLPMRKEFWKVPEKKIRREVKNILITFGGEDLRCMSPRVLKILTDEFPELTKVLVIGKGFNKDIIKVCEDIADKRTRMVYYPNAEAMKDLMLKADIAISAGGQTLYELARIGVPTIAIIVADNQEMQVKTFFERGFLYGFFYWDEFDDTRLSEYIEELQDVALRKEKSEIGRSLIDGRGAHAVVEEFLKCLRR